MKKRILFINGHLNAGGVERSLVDVLKHIDKDVFDVDLMLFQGEGDYRDEIPSEVNVYSYDVTPTYGPLLNTLWASMKRLSPFLFMYRLAVLFGNPVAAIRLFCKPCHKHYDTVISYRTGLANAIAIKCIKADKRISWWHHGEMNVFGKEKEILAKEYRQFDTLVSVSDACTQMLQKEFPQSSDKFVTIPNMLCAEEIVAKSKLYDPQLDDTFNIVTVGRLSSEKNMILCLKVASALKEQNISFHWNIIGGGEQYEELQQKVQELQLSKYVTLQGNLINPYPLIANSDLYFHPSLVESQGLTILEAMALGVPTVSVLSDGPKAFVKDGVNGYLINPVIEESAKRIIELYNGPKQREAVANEGLKTVKRFAPSITMERIENLICL